MVLLDLHRWEIFVTLKLVNVLREMWLGCIIIYSNIGIQETIFTLHFMLGMHDKNRHSRTYLDEEKTSHKHLGH